jgi:F-type H+-transporting ATPase subunit gamma
MQLVAASKMRRAQEMTKASAPYTFVARKLLKIISQHMSVQGYPLFVERPIKSRLLIVITSDRGLAGAYNSNVIKAYLKQLQDDKKNKINTKTIAVGRKVAQFATRIPDNDIIGFYEDMPDRPSGPELRAILDTAREQFLAGEVDAVDLIFTEFISGIRQEVRVQRALPAGVEPVESAVGSVDARYEPGSQAVLDAVAYRLVEAQIFQALLESRASEYSMRMVAMKNSTDNATDLIDDLTLAMNKVRQGAITQELAEISGGVEALKE